MSSDFTDKNNASFGGGIMDKTIKKIMNMSDERFEALSEKQLLKLSDRLSKEKERFGYIEQITSLVHAKGITINKMLKSCDMSPSSFDLWRKGKAKPSMDALIKMADFFNVSIDYLVNRDKPLDTTITEVLNQQFTREELELINDFRKLERDKSKQAFLREFQRHIVYCIEYDEYDYNWEQRKQAMQTGKDSYIGKNGKKYNLDNELLED